MLSSVRVLPLVLFIPLFLASCSGNQTSVEKNARHMAYQIEQVHFDPNTKPLTADNTRLMTSFLSQFYEIGKQDREAGFTSAQAQQRVDSFSTGNGPFSPGAQKTTIINRDYDSDLPEKRSEILKQGAIATYLDGYNGRP
ncbi:Exc2 family lipoprotein [Enterobacter mori]|uniref:Exc2 family lipoprotein n=1 Tax=Enterobacter mori TaxID=539813 RepID=UPI00285F03D5|nr:Exc2 family lipoprotein [Enterobacter hormaechei]HDR2565366.1 Exc2 family lipoprotein [Enterobacter ludwigii]HDR2709942.1 Exc2 family lipoprotein [Enterobacter mori]